MVSEAVKRRVDRARAEMEAYSAKLFEQQIAWRDTQRRKPLAQMFPSTQEGDRGATSPLGGLAGGVWSGKP